MHRYIEKIRNSIEDRSGQESYLTSSLFYRLYQELHYEDEGKQRFSKESEYNELQKKILQVIQAKPKFNAADEVLSWQAAILRDVAREYYTKWVEYVDKKFFAPAIFSDGVSCVAIEAICEKLDEDPTGTYTTLLETEHVLTRLTISCNHTIIETSNLWKFTGHAGSTEVSQNDFLQKRITNETQKTILHNSIERLQTVSDLCKRIAHKTAGSDHVMWINPHLELESLIHTLKGFLHGQYRLEPELTLDDWVDTLFPEDMDIGLPNPNRHGPLHHRIIARLAQATQCMVLHTVKGQNSFEQRDELIAGFIEQELEAAKIMELAEASNSTEKLGNASRF